MADDEQVELLFRSVAQWNKWRRENPNVQICLQGENFEAADLTNANLEGADLTGAKFFWSVLHGTNFTNANLVDVNFSYAKFHGANFTGANLSNVTLSDDADLFSAVWQDIKIDGKTYYYNDVKSGKYELPFGMGKPVEFVFSCDFAKQDSCISGFVEVVKKLDFHTQKTSSSISIGGSGNVSLVLKSLGDSRETVDLAFAIVGVTQQIIVNDEGVEPGDIEDEGHCRGEENTPCEQDDLVEALVYLASQKNIEHLRLVKILLSSEDDVSRAVSILEEKNIPKGDISIIDRTVHFGSSALYAGAHSGFDLSTLAQILQPEHYGLGLCAFRALLLIK